MKLKNSFKALLALGALVVCCGSADAQSMRMVVTNSGEVVGRYVDETPDTYIINVQDDESVPKAGKHVEVFSAENGQGVLYAYNETRINVRNAPSATARISTHIPPAGDFPECYPCLGVRNGWYKTRVNGKVGYVRADLLQWDAMDTF